MRLANERPRQVAESMADGGIAAGPAALGDARDVGLHVVRAELATLGLQEARVAGNPPGVCPVAGRRAMHQRVMQGVLPRVRLRRRWPRREPLGQRAVVAAERDIADRLGDVRADRIVVQPVLALSIRPRGVNQNLLGPTQERPSRRVPGPGSHGTELIECERLARRAQDPESLHDHGVVGDALPRPLDQRPEAARNVPGATQLRGRRRHMPPQLHRVLHVATRARHHLIDEPRVQPKRSRGALPERAHRRIVVGRAVRNIEINLDKFTVARFEARHVRVARPARAQEAHPAWQRMRQERRERIARQRLHRRVVLVEPVDQHDQALAARTQLLLGYPRERLGQPRRRMHPRTGVRLARTREALVDLRNQRAHHLRGVIPVVRAPANEVMRHHGAHRLAPRQPRRQDGTLAHPRTAGDHHPAIVAAVDQQLIEAGHQRVAPDELLVPLPLVAIVERLRGGPHLGRA